MIDVVPVARDGFGSVVIRHYEEDVGGAVGSHCDRG